MKKIIIFAVIGLVVVAGAVGGTIAVMGGGGDKAKAAEAKEAPAEEVAPPAAAAVYHEFHPDFVVNITDKRRSRFLQIDLAAVAQSQSDVDALKVHMPAVRNDLVVLFSSQTAEPLRSQEGKEALRQEALKSIQDVMEKRHGKPTIEDVFFNKFVIQ